jgi:hypothetical protein
MNNDKLINNQEAKTLKSIIIGSLMFSIFLGILHYLLSYSFIWFVGIFITTFLLSMIFSGKTSGTVVLYDGWIIKDSILTISKHSIFGYKEKFLKFSEIQKITYSESAYRKHRYLIINSDQKKFFLYIKYDIFTFADTLKYFKNAGIQVVLSEKDAEIELYLSDKIKQIPMTND